MCEMHNLLSNYSYNSFKSACKSSCSHHNKDWFKQESLMKVKPKGQILVDQDICLDLKYFCIMAPNDFCLLVFTPYI